MIHVDVVVVCGEQLWQTREHESAIKEDEAANAMARFTAPDAMRAVFGTTLLCHREEAARLCAKRGANAGGEGVLVGGAHSLASRFQSWTAKGIAIRRALRLRALRSDPSLLIWRSLHFRPLACFASPLQILKLVNFLVPSTPFYSGSSFFTRSSSGKLLATPLLSCLICIELSDFVFAIDSIPAVL